MKKILHKILLLLSFIILMVIDIIILLSVYSMVNRILVAFNVSEQISFIIGIASTIIVLGYLRLRGRVREFQRPTTPQIKDCCDGQCGCEHHFIDDVK